MEVVVPVLVILALIVANGLFVAAEFAIIGAPHATIERKAADGHAVARLVSAILRDPQRQDRYIATAQLGITFASLGLGMYGEHIVAGWLYKWFDGIGVDRWITAHTLATVGSVTVLTYLHIVLGEMIPKSLALTHAGTTALSVTRPILAFKTMLYPLVIGLNEAGALVLRLLGVRRQVTTGNYHTPEELRFVIEESQEGGLLRREQGRVLRDLFDLGKRSARELMVPRTRIAGLPVESAARDLREIVRTRPHTRFPVFVDDLDHVRGVVHIKDVLRLIRDGKPLEISSLRPIAFVPETADVDSILEAMRRSRTQLVIVMDEQGGTSGMITIDDLCVEVLGVVEEGRDNEPEIRRQPDGSVECDGTARLDEIGEVIGFELDHPDVDTASGLVLAMLERPPVVGDAVEYSGLRFVVTTVDGNGVGRCVVVTIPAAA